jgi:hypothetical protein
MARLNTFDPRQRGIVREAIVLGFAAGAQWGRFWDGKDESYIKDSAVIDSVLSDARAFSDLFPKLARIGWKDREQLDLYEMAKRVLPDPTEDSGGGS